MAVKFPLKMSDGTVAGTMEELREHFDLEAVLGYYSNGRLVKWLEDRYYDEEADQIRGLKESSKKFNQKLCGILGVPYSEKADKGTDIREVKKKNKNYELLKQYTTDETILLQIDNVAFTQDELIDLACALDEKSCLQEADGEGDKVIYLCGEHFEIPRFIGGITYKGINNPKVEFWGDPTSDEKVEAGIDFQDVDINFDDYIAKYGRQAGFFFLSDFETYPDLAIRVVRASAEKGTVEAWTALGECYERGIGVKKDIEEAVKWYQKVPEPEDELAKKELSLLIQRVEMLKKDKEYAEHGDAYHQYLLGKRYLKGNDVEVDEKEATRWLLKAAEQGYEEALAELEILCRDHQGDEIGQKIAQVLNTLRK